MTKKIFSLIILLFTINNVMATHLVGGEMTYTHVSGNTYQIKLTIYRDNFNGSAAALLDDPAVIYVYDDNGNYVTELDISNPTIINNIIPANLNPCLVVPSNIDFQKGTYTKNITLPNANMGYYLIYGRCCRNGALINNLTNPGDQGIGVTTHIPPSATYSNSSPTFDLNPPQFVCLGSPLSEDQSVTDINGDSLYYKMCTPWQALDPANPANNPGSAPPFGFGPPFTPVVWQAPFNQNNALGGVPVTVDPNTGLVSGIPNSIGTFVVGICVEEWRNGVLLNTLLRDFPYTVTNCNIPTAAIPIVGSVPVSSLPFTVNIPTAIVGIYELNCDSLNIKFNNTSTLPGGGTATATNAQYYWNFGDGSTSTAFAPTHTFPDTGTYLVKTAITLGKNLRQSNRTMNALTDIEIVDLQYIKSLDLPIATKAEAILALNGFEMTDHIIKNISFIEYAELTSVNNTSFNYELSTSPNPASTTTNVSFVLPVESANYKLKITDNYQNIGSLVYDTEINNLNTKSITVSNFANGVYTISIFKNDTEVASIQLLVTH